MSARALALLLLLAGCSAPSFLQQEDAGQSDGGNTDGGGPLPDAGATDAGSPSQTVLRVHYPAQGRMLFARGAGGGLSWSEGVPMAPGADDVWTLALDGLTASVEWKPLLDDETWARGPNFHAEPGGTVDVFPHFVAAPGTVTKLYEAFSSHLLGNARDVWVYLPPVYLQNSRARLPVLYLHDGQNLFSAQDASYGVEWQVDEAFDAAAEAGTCDDDPSRTCQNDGDCPLSACHTFAPAIVIGVQSTAARIEEYTPTADSTYGGGRGDVYLQFLATELKPQVDAALRTQPGPEGTLLAGSSLGGLISVHAGLTQPEVWGRIGALSPSSWWDERSIVSAVAASAHQTPRPFRVYVDVGDSGPTEDGKADTELLAAAFRDAGYTDGEDFLFLVSPGDAHNEAAWARRFPGALRFLLGPRP